MNAFYEHSQNIETLQSNSSWRLQHDQNFCSHVQWTCTVVTFEMVSSTTGTRSDHSKVVFETSFLPPGHLCCHLAIISVFAEVECSSSCVDQRFRVLRSEPYCISPFLSTLNLLTYCQLSDYTALYVPLMKITADLNNRTRLSVAICVSILGLMLPLIDFRKLLCSWF